jgi:leader peptidase (prepilin peptidase) / N-methyltransferase
MAGLSLPLSDLLPVVLGPIVGSFLYALVLRYPELTGFAVGRSACPACGGRIAARDLVPLVSWVLLKGRCRACAARIGWQYPAVEIAAAGLALWAATEMSGWLLWASCGLGWTLLALALVDLRCSRLPDPLTLPLLLAGLAVTALAWPTELADHLLGAVFGYAGLAAIGWLYRALRGREGLGLGDAKLLAAGGAWLSWQALPSVVLIAAALALAVVLGTGLARRMPLSAATRVPFGPYLAAAIWLVWLYGPLLL